MPWAQALGDYRSVQLLCDVVKEPVEALVPDRSINAFDLLDASKAHLLMVVPRTTLPLAPTGPYPQDVLLLPKLQVDGIYVVNGMRTTTRQLVALLGSLRAEMAGQGLAGMPLGSLR